jgi:hypothetical protein
MYRAGEMKSAYRVFIVKPEGNSDLEDPDIDERFNKVRGIS